jgi:hypothetical protein
MNSQIKFCGQTTVAACSSDTVYGAKHHLRINGHVRKQREETDKMRVKQLKSEFGLLLTPLIIQATQ